MEAIEPEAISADEYAMVDQLQAASKLPIPAALADLKTKERRFTESIEKTDMQTYVLGQLGLA